MSEIFLKNEKITKINQHQITEKISDSIEKHLIINYTAYQSEIVKIICNNINQHTLSLQLYHNKTFLHIKENNDLFNLKTTYKKMYNLNNKLKYLINNAYWIYIDFTSLPSSLIYITEEIINDDRKNKTNNLSNLPNKVKNVILNIPKHKLKKNKFLYVAWLQTKSNGQII